MNKKMLSQVDRAQLGGRVVVVRADLNVPLDARQITDDQRIRASLPTLELLADAGARVVVLSHLGRPKGAPNPDLSLEPVQRRLAQLLGRDVRFVDAVSGPDVSAAVAALEEGGIALLQNTRYHAGDTANDRQLSESWASLTDLFVNDAFGTAHRAHASTSGLAEAVRDSGGRAVAGLLLAREIRFLGQTLEDPERPFSAVLGGAKISGKIDVIQALLPRVDRLLVGGAMANTFFRALGLEVGASLFEEDRVPMAREVLEAAGDRLLLPVDCVVTTEIRDGEEGRIVDRGGVGTEDRIVDIGPASRALFAQELTGSRTIVWNGPMGVFEFDAFAQGTLEVARAAAAACDQGSTAVLGGGDSAAAAQRAGVVPRLSHVSTGGGASLEFLAGRVLPGVASLSEEI